MATAVPTGSGSERPARATASSAEPRWQRIFIAFVKVGTILFGILFGTLIVGRLFFFEPFNIPSGAMQPTLLIGDYVFVSKLSYGYGKYSFPFLRSSDGGRILGSPPQRGDVAVFALPRDPKVDFIQRIVGLPGDHIKMSDGVLSINDQPVEMTRIEDTVDPDPHLLTHTVMQFIETLPDGGPHRIYKHPGQNPLDDTAMFTVPAGHVFMMGDNRDNSLDSRIPPHEGGVGFVPFDNLIGRADIRWFSYEKQDSWWNLPFGVRYSRLLTWVD